MGTMGTMGTMGHTVHKRWVGHLGTIRRGDEDNSTLAKHHLMEHSDIEPEYKGTVMGGNLKNPYIVIGYRNEISR